MKNSSLLTSLILAAACSAAIVAQLAGQITLSVRLVSILVGGFTAASVLAVAFSDYSRRANFRWTPRVRTMSRRVSGTARPAASAANTAWVTQTISA